jgi:branched-chain amino acid transport system substrate-binding protein
MRFGDVKLGFVFVLLMGIAVSQTSAPYHEGASQPRTYNGPGREEPEPAQVSSVNIGYFGPTGPGAAQSLWQGASLAVGQANRAKGYHGVPFKLVPSWSENPWSGGISDLVRSVYKDNLWAIIGGIDGASTHLAEQITTKIQITLVNPIATDRGIHSADVPWVFSCVPGDDAAASLIAEALSQSQRSFALLSSTGHDSRAFVTELNAAFARQHMVPALHVEFADARHPMSVVGRIASSAVAAVVLAANAEQSRELIAALRQAGFTGTIYATATVAGHAADDPLHNTITPVLGRIQPDFRNVFLAAYGHQPDYAAAHAYDATNLLIAAIRRAGLNRARVRDAVRDLSPYDGASGLIEWDALGRNRRPIVLERVSGRLPSRGDK